MVLINRPHRRFNPLTGDWVLVSPHRTQRPWLGQVETPPVENVPAYDADCYLCPGNLRSGGTRNPMYASTFVFDNDFAALLPPQGYAAPDLKEAGLIIAQPEAGRCQVTCFSPRHDLTIPELPQKQVEAVVRAWIEQTRQLGSLDYISYVQIFENKGSIMGASNPHPHSQVWASELIPNEPAKELFHQSNYVEDHGACLLCSYLAVELKDGERIVASNEAFTALVPYWAVWPFEVLVLANRHMDSLLELDEAEQSALADVLRQVTTRYDNLFQVSFPYSFGFHQAPSKGGPFPGVHLHAHYYPPLLRSATVRKFMVGYELMAEPQRDITPETAAEQLRGVSDVRFKVHKS